MPTQLQLQRVLSVDQREERGGPERLGVFQATQRDSERRRVNKVALWVAQRLLGDEACFRSEEASVHLSKHYWRNGWV